MLYKDFLKRTIDLLAASSALILLSPLMLLLMLALKITGHHRIFFTQKRVGKNDKIFKLVKFISMTDQRDEQGNLLPDELRLTRFGKWLRGTSLDELPQLINVVRGDMSLIGPRPLLVQYLPLYNTEQKKRHQVRPGITGWAQVNGRNAISWETKFELDVWYVQNISFIIDCKIILLTLKKIVKKDGISQEGQATMTFFTGTPEKDSAQH